MARLRRLLVCVFGFGLSPAMALAIPRYDHVVVVMEENHTTTEIIGSGSAPYLNSLANDGVSFSNFYAITHPSQPNYLQLFSGSNQGVLDDALPSTYPTPFTTPNLGAELLNAGYSFGGFSQGLPSVGYNGFESGSYVRRHNPWTNWQDGTPAAGPNNLPPGVNVPFTGFPTTAAGYANLPTVSFVVPDVDHDMHDGTVQQADTWVQTNVNGYYQWAKNNNSLLIVTWDEDNGAVGNRIPTIFAGPGLATGVNGTTHTLHNLLHTLEDMYGLPHAGASAHVGPLLGVFQNEPPLATATRTFRQGVGGYNGMQDTQIGLDRPTTNNGAAVLITVDADISANGSNQPAQALLRFDGLFGDGPGQIPLGAAIVSAKLRLKNDARSDQVVRLHHMLVPWDESSTWQSLTGGVSADDVEAAASDVFSLEPGSSRTSVVFVVTESVQRWADGETNFGWALLPTGSDGWTWNSSEAATLDERPFLEVIYVVPEPASGVLGVTLFTLGLALARRHGKLPRRMI